MNGDEAIGCNIRRDITEQSQHQHHGYRLDLTITKVELDYAQMDVS